MAQKRMFSQTVISTDKFLDLPSKAQNLYWLLGMDGDDDGFIGSPKKVARTARCTEKELAILEQAGFILRFPSGVVCMVHWWVNNTLKNDRYTPTVYQEELGLLRKDDSGMYHLAEAQEATVVAEIFPCEVARASTHGESAKYKPEITPEPAGNRAGTEPEPQHNITEQNRT